MAWSPEQVQAEVDAFRADPARWQTDYSKLLIIVTGNLDEMYEDLAERVEDCDTDADVFHAMSQRLSVIDVKKALGSRFRPEQVARLGNQHVIYPSLSRSAYQRLIARTCAQYVDEVAVRSGLRIDVAQPVLDEIYANGVFPAQGTRPVFSTVHGVLGGSLVRAALWAIERGAPPGAVLPLTLGDDRKHLCVRWGDAEQRLPVVFELEGLRERASLDFRTLLAVHEAGHGLVYAVLMGTAPQEVRINVASFNGGYASYAPQKAWSRRMLRDVICVSLAGRAAEALVFGPDAATTGAEADRKQATANAIAYVRHHGFGSRVSRTDVTTQQDEDINTDVQPTNAEAEALMCAEAERATALLRTHGDAFRALVQELLTTGTVPAAEFAKVTGIAVTAAAPHAPSGPEPWHARWSAFAGDGA
ncbi:M41 family metallopeptidase [Ottowia flava]